MHQVNNVARHRAYGWRRLWRRAKVALASPARLMSNERRLAIEASVHEQANLTPAYGFMLFSACGIAALGLLQSSVAVVIGAMLISPLMGPIMSMGLSLARIDPRAFKAAASTLLFGAALSVGAATLIVWAVPLKEVTPEILARTRPTLLDLIVAVLSGFVGAYLTIKRQQGAIAGVAIATALMPPLAVLGYGCATANWSYAGGALLLFLTNVVAILAAVFGVARCFGFGPRRRTGPAWEVWVLVAAIAVLSLPLAFSLRDIVVQARETGRVRVAIENVFQGAQPHVAELEVQTRGGSPDVQGVVITRRYVSDAANRVARLLGGATVIIEQVVSADGMPKSDASGGALINRPAAARSFAMAPEERLRLLFADAADIVSVERRGQGLEAQVVLSSGAKLDDYRVLEHSAQQLMPSTPIILRPPISTLPDVRFRRGASTLDDAGLRTVDTVAWALSRWDAAASVEGLASPGRRGPRPIDQRLAARRADAVAAALRERGVTVESVTASVSAADRQPEDASWAARVRPAPRAAAPGRAAAAPGPPAQAEAREGPVERR